MGVSSFSEGANKGESSIGIRNSKLKIRDKRSNLKEENPKPTIGLFSAFFLRISGLFRISDFDFRIDPFNFDHDFS